jgi:hypothetical protein
VSNRRGDQLAITAYQHDAGVVSISRRAAGAAWSAPQMLNWKLDPDTGIVAATTQSEATAVVLGTLNGRLFAEDIPFAP